MDNLAAEIAGSQKGRAQAPDKPRKRDLLVERRTDCEKARIIEQYGIYPENHPLTKYVRSLVPEKNRDKVAVYVTRAWEEPNAAALPDGTIFVTDSLVKFCRYDEELRFVLQHEIKHITGGHAVAAMGQKGMDGLGFSRMKEYEADLAEIITDEHGCSVNAYGAVVFLNRLAEYEKAGNAAPDAVHGSTYARLIGVEHAIRLVDMDALSSELHEIPAQVKETIKHARDPEAQFWSAKKFECIKKAAMRMGLHASLHTLERIHTQEKGLTNAQKGELAGILLQNIQKEARVHFPSASEEAIKVFSKFLFVGSADTCPPSNRLAHEIAISPLLYTEFKRMLETFPEGIKVVLDGRENTNLYEAAALLELGKRKPKESYSKVMSLRSAMKEAISRSGGDQAWLYDDTMTARVLLATFGKEKTDIQKYFDAIGRDGLAVEKMRLFRHVCAHFCLDRDGAAMLASFRFFADCDRKALLASLNPEPEVAKTDKWDIGPKADFARYSKRVASAINPKSFADLLAFLDRLNGRKSHDLGISDVENLFGQLVHLAPAHLHAAIMEHLGITSLDNGQAIELSQRLILFWQGRTYVFMLCKGRAFSNDELVKLKEAIGSDNMAFVVYGMLKAARSREDAFALLKFTALRIFDGGAERILYSGDTLVGPDNIALDIFRRYAFDMGNPEHLDQMLSVSCFVTDPNMRMRLQKAILARYAPMLDAKEAYALLFKDMRVADYAAVGAREEYLDKRVTDAAELDGIKKDILQRIKDAEAQAGNAMILGESLTRLLIRDKARLLRALLMTGESNRELLSYVGEEALRAYLYEREDVRVIEEREWQSFRDINIEEYENGLHKLDYEGRAVLAQELLIGEKGVLLDKKTRKEALKWFFENFIEKPEGGDEEKVHSFIRRAFMAVADGADVPTLYFLIHPIITERILAKPKHSEGWGEALRIAKERVLRKSVKTAEDRAYHSSELEDAIYHVEEWVGHNRKDAEMDVYDTFEPAQNTAARLEEACTKYLDDFQDASGPMKPIEFVKNIASKMGAPGVRFLQSLGIYADIPPSLRKEFDDVYDSMKGQLKLSALNTLQKEWGPDELEKQLKTFGSRVGGGSLVTVYDCVVNGRRCALKVVNPNIAYRTDAVCDNLVNIFSGDEELRRGLPLVENIREWVKTDVHFQGADYAGAFSSQNNGFRAEGNPYSISVPDVIRRGSKSVAEDYVEGTNLTKWEEASAAHDMRQVISLVVKNAVQQVANGLVHADMHVGNIRIAGGGKVAWLDNNFLLVLGDRDKEFIGSLACLANDKPALAKALSDYLCGFEENRHVDRASLEASLKEILVSNGHRDVGSFVSDAVAAISRHKGVVPLNVMLLAKNALALERMAKRAGFTNLMDAYFA